MHNPRLFCLVCGREGHRVCPGACQAWYEDTHGPGECECCGAPHPDDCPSHQADREAAEDWEAYPFQPERDEHVEVDRRAALEAWLDHLWS